MKWLLGSACLVVLFLAFGFMQSSTPEGKERAKQRDTIALCWDSQGKRSNSAGTAQFIAGACERMESEYIKRWGRKP